MENPFLTSSSFQQSAEFKNYQLVVECRTNLRVYRIRQDLNEVYGEPVDAWPQLPLESSSSTLGADKFTSFAGS